MNALFTQIEEEKPLRQYKPQIDSVLAEPKIDQLIYLHRMHWFTMNFSHNNGTLFYFMWQTDENETHLKS